MRHLKELRQNKGLSQQSLADTLGVSRSTIAMWETGASQPDHGALSQLADFFGTTVDYLLGRSDTPNELSEPDEPEHTFRYAASLNIDPKDMTAEIHASLETVAREMIRIAKARKSEKDGK